MASEGSPSESMTSVGPTGDDTSDSTGDTHEPGPIPTATSPMTGADTEDPSTTSEDEPSTCDIFMVVADAAVGKTEPDDCGYVQLDDPVAFWEVAQQCALDHHDGGLAFTLVAEQQGIDSAVHLGFAGAQGEVYMASRFFSDSGAVVPGTHITGGPCNIVPILDCIVEPGNLCLDCGGDSPEPMTICEEP